MIKSRASLKYYKFALDLALLVTVFFISSYLARRHMSPTASVPPMERWEYFLLTMLVVVWYFSARFFRLYDEFRNRTFSSELVALIKTVLMQATAAVILLFFIKTLELSRFFVLIYISQLFFFTVSDKLLCRTILHRLHTHGRNLNNILVLGAGSLGQAFAKMVGDYSHLGYRVVGFLDEEAQPEIKDKYLGGIDRIEEVLEKYPVDDVLVALPACANDRLNDALAACQNYPVNIRIVPEYFPHLGAAFSLSLFGHLPVISLHNSRLEEFHWHAFKRLFDVSLAVFLFLFVFSWLWPLVALAIKMESRGPVFFRQERWGIRNRKFMCYKFRTMFSGSCDVDENGHYRQASADDSRVTRMGRFLRRRNLDELPQFINVLKGDMSIIGPRPHPTPLNLKSKQTIDHYLIRHIIRPGITGWAQVNGLRGETREKEDMQQRVEYDIWYIRNWSMWLDFQIILRTLWRTFHRDPHAY